MAGFWGSNNAIENLAVVQSMFDVRDLVREYLNETTTLQRRAAILKELASKESGTPTILDAIIQQMKPIEPTDAVDNYTGETAIEFQVEVPGTAANPAPTQFRCIAHLPSAVQSLSKISDDHLAARRHATTRSKHGDLVREVQPKV